MRSASTKSKDCDIGHVTQEARLLLACSRTSMSDAARSQILNLATTIDSWRAVVELARYHGVAPLMYRALRLVCPDLVPKEPLDALRSLTQAGALLNRSLAQELIHLCQAFDEQSVPVIPFKGATLAVAAYGDLALRDFDDLDFIVPKERASDAQQVLWAQGYRPRDRSHGPMHAEEPYHVFVKKQSLLRIDLQWTMAHERFSFRLDRPEIWDHLLPVSIGGVQIRALAPEELLIVLCVHGSKHAWEQLKWVADVSELLRSHRVDWRRVFAVAKKWKCRRMLVLGLMVAYRLLDAPLPGSVVAGLAREGEVAALAGRMPKSLLTRPQEGIDDQDNAALYLSLKDSRWNRWNFGLTLLRDDHPVVHDPPAWLRAGSSLTILAGIFQPLRRCAAQSRHVKRLLRAVGRLHEHAP